MFIPACLFGSIFHRLQTVPMVHHATYNQQLAHNHAKYRYSSYKQAVFEYNRIKALNQPDFDRLEIYYDPVEKAWKLGHISTHGYPSLY